MAGSPRCVEVSVRVYEVLLKAYPASFRREYGNEMALVFREHLTEMWRKRGTLGLIAAWFRLPGDLARTVPAEHFFELRRRMEMRTAAIAVFSVVVAAMANMVTFYVMAWIGLLPWLVGDQRGARSLPLLLTLYLSAFLTGLLLTRAKPFFAPVATVPLGTMLISGLLVYADSPPSGNSPGWLEILARVGFVASMGLASLAGCMAAVKTRDRLAGLSLRWFQLVGPLAVLVCTSSVAVVIRIVLVALERGNEIDADFQQALSFCLFALLVIGAVTIANLVVMLWGQVRLIRGATAMLRNPWLVGVLSGLVVGFAFMLGFQSIEHSGRSTSARPAFHASYPRPLPGKVRVHPATPVPIPNDPVPPNWERRDFNGVPYYIVPLACTDPRYTASALGAGLPTPPRP